MKRDLPEIEDRLREWAAYFKDRRRLDRCKSIEHRFTPHGEDFAKEGWGDDEAAPTPARKPLNVIRAIQTHDAVMQLPHLQKWSITYAYCYPALPRGMVLRCLKKWLGKPVSWKVFVEQVEVGKYRVAAILA